MSIISCVNAQETLSWHSVMQIIEKKTVIPILLRYNW